MEPKRVLHEKKKLNIIIKNICVNINISQHTNDIGNDDRPLMSQTMCQGKLFQHHIGKKVLPCREGTSKVPHCQCSPSVTIDGIENSFPNTILLTSFAMVLCRLGDPFPTRLDINDDARQHREILNFLQWMINYIH